MQMNRFLNRAARFVGLMAFAAGLPTLPVATTLLTASPVVAQASAATDSIVLKSGKTVTGKILEETASEVKIQLSIGGITSTMAYAKSEIVSISRGTAAAAPQPAVASNPTKDIKAPAAMDPNGNEKKRIYTIELTGQFGQDISQTPIREALKDAKKNNADIIVVVMDNDWSVRRQGMKEQLNEDDTQFEGFWRAEDIDPVLTEEIEREWTKKPQVVFWIKNAMGGAAFLPLSCPTIYFHSDGKMGGIGHVEDTVRSGDRVVKEKLIGARLGHVRGMANKGGYDARIVLAMARTEYVLSYRMVGGKPEFLERAPASPDEFPLTDDGQESNEDTDDQLARNEGNDNLTLKAELALKLGISKGTVDTFDDLIYQMGLARSSTPVEGKSKQIMKAWRDGLDNAKRKLRKLWADDYRNVAVKDPGGYNERTAARNRQKSIINEMQTIEKRYEEALNPRAIGVPGWSDLETMKKELELEQMKDKKK